MVLKIFFSWQVETNLQGFNNKAFLIECIESAIKQIENRGALKGIRLKLTEGLRNIPGNPEVSQLMFDQIDNCDIFIGDITVVQKYVVAWNLSGIKKDYILDILLIVMFMENIIEHWGFIKTSGGKQFYY